MTPKSQSDVGKEQSASNAGETPKPFNWLGFVLVTLGLAICFGKPLYDLARFSAPSELYSHIFLIPVVSLYLVWDKRRSLPHHSPPAFKLAIPFLISGFVLVGSYWLVGRTAKLSDEDYLAWTIFSFLLFFCGVCCLFFGKKTLRAIVFPIGFLVFMVPIPTVLMDWTVTFLQHTSAAAAAIMFKLVGTPILQTDLHFRLPGMRDGLDVAPECSGIHSTLVLFITSFIAGHLFLRSPWKRAFLVVVVVPLAIVRNGLRIFIIGELCVHIGPHMIDSYIHRRGGPIFFALSLVPFFLLLYVLRKSEFKKRQG